MVEKKAEAADEKEEPTYVFNEEPEEITSSLDSALPAQASTVPVVKETAPVQAIARRQGFPTDEEIRAKGLIEINSQSLVLKLSHLGARIVEADLKKFRDTLGEDSKIYNLVEHTIGAPFPLGVYASGFNDSWVSYQILSTKNLQKEGNAYLVKDSSEDDASIVLRGQFPDGREVSKIISLSPKGYLLDVSVVFSSVSQDPRPFELEWTNYVPEKSGSLLDPYNITGYAWYDGSSVTREAFSDFEDKKKELGSVTWASMGGKYFTSALISPNTPTSARAIRTSDLHRIRFASGDSINGEYKAYLGPKGYRELEATGYGLEKNVNFGWAGFLSAPMLSLLHLFYGIFKNYGIAIVVLTILVKLALFPLTNASFKSMKAMQTLAPEVAKLKKNVKDRQKQQQEIMALYRKKGVNPLGGCLPMLLQMPVFFGLYSGLIASVELRHAPFGMWIMDLSSKESLMIAGFSVPVMVIFFSLAMLAQQWLTPSNMDPAQKKAMLVMPLVFGFIFANLPAGCVLYSLTNSLISIGQQQALHRNWNSFKATSLLSIVIFVASVIFSQL